MAALSRHTRHLRAAGALPFLLNGQHLNLLAGPGQDRRFPAQQTGSAQTTLKHQCHACRAAVRLPVLHAALLPHACFLCVAVHVRKMIWHLPPVQVSPTLQVVPPHTPHWLLATHVLQPVFLSAALHRLCTASSWWLNRLASVLVLGWAISVPWFWPSAPGPALCVVCVAAAPESALAVWLLDRSAPLNPPPTGFDTLGFMLPAFQIVVLLPDASDGTAWTPDAAFSWLAAPSAVPLALPVSPGVVNPRALLGKGSTLSPPLPAALPPPQMLPPAGSDGSAPAPAPPPAQPT